MDSNRRKDRISQNHKLPGNYELQNGELPSTLKIGGKKIFILNFFQALCDSIVGDISTIPVILIDVRSPIEISTQKSLPTAHNIPISKIEKAFQKSNQEFKIDHGFEKPSKDYPNVI